MNRFLVGFLAGALFMYWLNSQSPHLLLSITSWLNETSRHYSGLKNTSATVGLR